MAARPNSNTSESTSASSGVNEVSGTGSSRQWMSCGGPILFTGPGGLRDYRAQVSADNQSVGIGSRSGEATSDLAYLSRQPPGYSFPLAKHGRVGEIGWPVETFKTVKGFQN
ncbi:uncharacterized protein LOC112560640 [Pomacea canaliculata]|uniref:uncharacterized protein LOC112560640 n=1 Tax=Pomacea canaliculata TaxID=400727 RepID=UPI000D7310F3|nr:uncharacterized protein LOC112560640 [Pomacea canaliculata]